MRSLLFVGCGCACCCGLIRLIPLIILVLKKKNYVFIIFSDFIFISETVGG